MHINEDRERAVFARQSSILFAINKVQVLLVSNATKNRG